MDHYTTRHYPTRERHTTILPFTPLKNKASPTLYYGQDKRIQCGGLSYQRDLRWHKLDLRCCRKTHLNVPPSCELRR
ncbi:hypothetical protein GpartN1_g5819.t1 [Galdieria partita]|uniref:Uncharacterized protein n=1 Tax=Galdieria partita TaxID=83374 RepID=A0A9C7Q075_9RHOD|nr:hypothetical protein GpartN1_g5819.t1 [Galdieria partita]